MSTNLEAAKSLTDGCISMAIQVEHVVNYVASKHWGDIASIIGLIVTALGFAVTLFLVKRSRSAAVAAKDASEATRDSLTRFDAVSKISAAIKSMDEIKRLHRLDAWPILLDRYSAVRQELVLIRSAVSPKHRPELDGAISQFTGMEDVVESALASNKKPPKTSKLNEIVSEQVDKMNELLHTLRQQIGSVDHGRNEDGRSGRDSA